MRAWTLVLIIVLLALVTPARAQPSEPAAAEPTPSAPTLYERGRAALEAKDGPAARRLFREGLATAAPGEERFRMLLGLALAYELLGEPAWAVLHYRAFAIASEAHPDGATEEWQARRARIAQELGKLEEALAASHGTVVVTSEPSGASLSLDGEALPAELVTPQRLRLPAGSHRLEARLGERRRADRIDVVAKETLAHTLALPEPPPSPAAPVPAAPKAAPPPQPSPAPAPPELERQGGHPAITWTGVALSAGGGAALTASAILFGLARSDASDLEDLQTKEATTENRLRDLELRSRISSRQAASVALVVTGGLMAVGGAITIVLNETDGDVSLALGPSGVGFHGRF